MSDFFQNGVITTFHKLGETDLCRIESQLKEFSQTRPIALVLPSLYREYASGALVNIMKVLKKVNYLRQINVFARSGKISSMRQPNDRSDGPEEGRAFRILAQFPGIHAAVRTTAGKNSIFIDA